MDAMTTNGTPKLDINGKSPFLAPRRRKQDRSSGAGTSSSSGADDVESKSSLTGAIFNLINAVIGAGILGIPYALKDCSLTGGIFMIFFCVVLTIRSLCLLVETAKHVDVPTYERLSQVAFGRPGFIFVALSMFIMAYGAMVSYLMIVKDTLPLLIGLPDMPRFVLFISTICVILPLSLQRDMANLSKTSILSVLLDCITVGIIIIKSPVKESISLAGGLEPIIRQTPDIFTFFIGTGILSFAFVCQHSAFLIAGSLQNPTRKRWTFAVVTSMVICGILASVCGFAGYVGYGIDTQGNILDNLPSAFAKGCMCVCMFLVYPMESYVARHVMVVTFFQGRSAQEGDDHSVLARPDRLVATTVLLYIAALVPATLCEDLGSVLSLTGAVGGSALSYIGPGAAYLGIHGEEFLKMIDDLSWGESLFFNQFTWYLSGMPLWYRIAKIGSENLRRHQQLQATLSPFPSRLGRVVHQHSESNTRGHLLRRTNDISVYIEQSSSSSSLERKPLLKRTESMPTDGESNVRPLDSDAILISEFGKGPIFSQLEPNSQQRIMLDPSSYGSTQMAAGNKGIGAALMAKQQKEIEAEEEDDPQGDPPTIWLFLVAIFYIIFGVIAGCAGVLSVLKSVN